ncbi:MAG: hypothetical protein BWY54_00555 [Candidatus Dependentiae bacterium ADurb.Bin331]|nr:MAG: hypothetical protein BWY54_00555 [Candidatus Dependentiae bacterium ADurb.Bin331]
MENQSSVPLLLKVGLLITLIAASYFTPELYRTKRSIRVIATRTR